jgi:acetylornithine deacetylase
MTTTDRILHHLKNLVAFDTQNPPRAIGRDDAIFTYLNNALLACPNGDQWDVTITDHDKGRVTFHATRGNPNLLFNVHLDTVPNGEGWSHDPHDVIVKDGKAYGRGTCDIKGAAAALLTLAETGVENMALLFTTDEEGTGSCCVREFCVGFDTSTYKAVIVAEPTSSKAVLGHRGYLSARGDFTGTLGHTSSAGATSDNALSHLTNWTASALSLADDNGEGELKDNRFNLGRIEGGIKPNMVANKAHVIWGMRPKPGSDGNAIFKSLTDTPEGNKGQWTVSFAAPSLPAAGKTRDGSEAFIKDQNLEQGDDVDFWTEASLFSDAGLNALVLGPGNITEAHAIDEWVALDQLELAYKQYEKLVG